MCSRTPERERDVREETRRPSRQRSASQPVTGLDDKTFLSLEVGNDRLAGTAVVCHRLTAPGGGFYGGAALALACSMMEYATGQPTVWCTTQLVSRATLDDVVDLRVLRVIAGRQSTQLRITATVDGRELFTAFGATGRGDPRLNKTFTARLEANPPEESPPVQWFFNSDPEHTYFGVVEFREATVVARIGCEAPPRTFWVRFEGAPTWTAARLAFVADLASTGVIEAANKAAPRKVVWPQPRQHTATWFNFPQRVDSARTPSRSNPFRLRTGHSATMGS